MANKLLIADSSSLIALDRRGRLDKVKRHRVLVPPAVRRELVDDALRAAEVSPAGPQLMQSALRFQYYIEHNDLQVRELDKRAYSKLIDRVRRRLAKLESTAEHRVKKGDVEVVALARQALDEERNIAILCEDRTLIRILREEMGDVEVLSHEDL